MSETYRVEGTFEVEDVPGGEEGIDRAIQVLAEHFTKLCREQDIFVATLPENFSPFDGNASISVHKA